MKKRIIILGAMITSVTIALIPIINASVENMTPSIVKVKSGLIIADGLNNENQTKEQLMTNQQYWHYTGSAVVRNALFDLYGDTQGLHIGVKAPSNGTYAGFFAVNPETKAMLFHSVISSGIRAISDSDNYFQNGLYVQTSNGSINYVSCVSVTNHVKTVWSVVSAEGDTGGARQFHVLWTNSSLNQPLTRECTVITNGQNYLKVYMDNVLVYSNNTLDLPMPDPFLTFLEVQSSYNGKPLYGTYRDFYITSNENIDVISNPSTATTVKLVDLTGAVLASGDVVDGTARLNVGKYHFPLTANIVVYNSTNVPIVSTSSPVKIFGGDVFSARQNWSIENFVSFLNL